MFGNKRGQGLSTNAIILIILGVLVLIVLIVGFSAGWEKIAPWISKGDNVQTVVTACDVACSTSAVYDYCSKTRDLKPEGVDVIKGNCSYFSTEAELSQYKISPCPGLCD